jgi:hypothetical protein
MSTDIDTTRVVRSWLRTDEHESADRVLSTVLAIVDATPQRQRVQPGRGFVDESTVAKLAMAAAAIVIAALVGFNVLPAGGEAGGSGVHTMSPSTTATSTPWPPPRTAAAMFPAAGELEVGRHEAIVEGEPMSFIVRKSGWRSSGLNAARTGGGISRGTPGKEDGAAITIWSPENVFAEPCAHTPMSPPAGPTEADLANAMAAIPGTDASGPSDVSTGWFAAKRVVLVVRDDIDCDPQSFWLWYDDAEGPRRATALGSTIRVWIYEQPHMGFRIVIEGETYKGASPQVEQELEQIVDSIRFEGGR